MSEAVAPRPETLADLIDSRPDLREILATNFNLAHAILLLRRGELEAVERALELAERQGNSEALIVAECIHIEMLRIAGKVPDALQRAEVLARKERFNVMAALYFRHLFPLMESTRHREPVADASDSVPGRAEDPHSAADSQSVPSVASVVADHEPLPQLESDIPSKWQAVAADPSVALLRIREGVEMKEVRRAEIASGVLEEQAFGITARILDRLSFGGLKHCSFEGAVRTIHTWQRADLKVAAVFQSGSYSSLLAARCTRAFEEHNA